MSTTRNPLMTGSHVWDKEYSESSVGQGETGKYSQQIDRIFFVLRRTGRQNEIRTL